MTARLGAPLSGQDQRGTAVPFTTPSLSMSRVRADERHELVLMVRGFGGSDGAYVVPWRSVPDLGPMSVHDRALHEEIGVNRAVTPGLVRRCALKVASTGLAGPAAAAVARAAIDNEERMTLETHFLLIASVLIALGVDIKELSSFDPRAGGWHEHARRLLAGAGARIGMAPGELFGRSGVLARGLAPVGLAQAPSGGRLRLNLAELLMFRESIGAWGNAEQTEFGRAAQFTGQVAFQAAGQAQLLLAQFDKRTAENGWVLRDWRQEAAVATAISNRLAWLLDGWDQIAALWSQARSENLEAQRDTVAHMLPILPVLPRTDPAAARLVVPTIENSRRSARSDTEMMARIEAAKARATPR